MATVNLLMSLLLVGWRHGVVVTALVVSTKLLYVKSGYYWDGDRVRVRLPAEALYFGM